jgi:quercetin dioxygenase-like cupin family protein
MSRVGLYVAMTVVIGTLHMGGRAQSVDHALLTSQDITWGNAPASLPPAAQAAVLEGDPAKEGPFTLRIRMPDGYRLPPHFHPAVEHVTVLQGTFVLGMGETVNTQAEKALNAGSFAYMPAGMRHFARAQGDTIIQLHGIGPWGITYVNPSDDPRSKR